MATGFGHKRMIERTSHLVVEQTLHGYGEGHELLASSSKLSREARRILLSISDLSGQGFVHGFDGYLTGYPLPTISKYALGRTWYAPEMSRPGCVWTHTLLIDFEDIPRLDCIGGILRHFRRPGSVVGTKRYEIPLEVEVDGVAASIGVTEGACLRVLDALYGGCVAPVLLEASQADEYDNLIFAVWAQQWPGLRRRFSFCTGALLLRSFGKSLLDLQIVPRSRRMRAERADPSVRSVDFTDREPGATREEWLAAAATDLRLSGSPLRTFLREYGGDTPPERAAFRPLTKCFLALEQVRRHIVPIGDLVSTVGREFPGPDSASRLKRDVLRPSARSADCVKIDASETELLLAALRTEYASSFDLKALRIEKRASRAIRSDGSSPGTLLPRLLESDRNAVGQQVVDKELSGVDVGRLRSLFESDDSLGERILVARPGLLYDEDLWRTPRYMQRACIAVAAAAAEASRSTIDVHRVLATALSARSDAIAQDAYDLLGKQALFAALAWIDDGDADSRRLPYRWRDLLGSHPSLVLQWFNSSRRPKRIQTLLLLTEITEPRDVRPEAIADETLVRWGRQAASTPDSTDATRIVAYLLAVGLRREDDHACDLVLATFPTIHEALLDNRLGWAEWLWLERLMPSDYWFFSRDWDKADKLRRALLDRFSVHGWSPNRLEEAAYNSQVRLYLRKTAQREDRWEKIVRQGMRS